jgi:dolichol-phosphate mannosyltransferase
MVTAFPGWTEEVLTVPTIVLPAFNEAAGLGPLLARIGDALGTIDPFQILVVDDGSTDGTAAIAQGMAGSLPVRVISHRVNCGYGRALRTGLTEAVRGGGTVVTLDADESHDPHLIPVMLEQIEAGYDMVIASRFRSGGAEVGVPWGRRLLSRSASLICRSTVSMGNVRDYTSGFRAYRASLVERMIRVRGETGFVRSASFAAGLELLLNAASLGARVAEVPLVLRYDKKRSTSKLRLTHDLPPYLSILFQHRFQTGSAKARWSEASTGATEARP